MIKENNILIPTSIAKLVINYIILCTTIGYQQFLGIIIIS